MVKKKLIKLMRSIGSSPHLKFMKKVPGYKKIYEKCICNPLSFPSIYSCSKEIAKKGPIEDIDQLLNYAYAACDGLISPGQVREEIRELISILKKNNTRYLLEIGTSNGGTLHLFCKVAAKDATIVSLDLDGYPSGRIPLYKSFASDKQKLTLLRGDSHSESSLNKVKSIFSDNKVDFLFIDGDHTYSGVKNDFQMYSPLVRKGGIIAFHDIVVHPPELKCEVNLFWEELKSSRKTTELIKDKNQGWGGIGLVYV